MVTGQPNTPLAAPLVVVSGKRVSLRHTTPRDYEFLYQLDASGDRATRYRLKGVTPGFEAYVQGLWSTVLVLFVVEETSSGRPLGAVIAYNADLRNSHLKLAAISDPTLPAGSHFLEGCELFIDYLFRAFPLRKLYGEVLQPNFEAFMSLLDGVAVEEGRLTGHEYLEGEWVDLHIIAIHRAVWDARRSRRTLADLVRERAAQTGTVPAVHTAARTPAQ